MASHYQPEHPNQQLLAREELVDFFWESLCESMGPDWSERDGAKRIVDDIERAGRLKSVLYAMKGAL